MSKIGNDLIKNFEATGKYKDDYQKEIKSLEEENMKTISDNINIMKTIGLEIKEEYLEENMDKIYADIINSLIKSKKFENYEFVLQILKDIDIENIDITLKIYDEINATLNNEEYVKDYKIVKKEDFFNESKINFYYILLRYIFKKPFYIYNLNFFFETRKLIINILRANEVINKRKNIPFNDKITFVIEKLADSDYYFLKLKKLEIIYKYYSEILFESKKAEIKLIEDIFENNKKIEDVILKDYEEAKKIIKNLPIIKFILEEKNKNKSQKRTESEIQKIVEIWKKLEKMIKALKIKRMKDDERQIICKYFRNEKNKGILLENFGQEIYDNFMIKINDFFKANEALEQENKKEEQIKNDNIKKLALSENNINNLITDKPRENEKTKDNPSFEESKIFGTHSSIDLFAAKPPLRKEVGGENEKSKKNILEIVNYILLKCKISFHTNRKDMEPYFLYDTIYYGENDLKISYSKLMEYKEDLYSYEEEGPLHKNLRYFFEFLEEIEKRILEEFENGYMLKINLELIKEKNNNNIDNIYNITAYFTFFEPFKHKSLRFKEENVLINKTNSNLQGFQFMLYEMNCKKYKDIQYSEEFLHKKEIDSSDDEKDKVNSIIRVQAAHEITASKYAIIEFIKTLGKTKYSADFIKELSNGYFIIGSQNTLQIYDHQFLEKPTLSPKCKDWVYSVCERVFFKEKTKGKKNLQVICCMNGSIGLLEIANKKSNLTIIETQQKQNLKKKSKKDKNKTKNTYNICFEMRENNYIMAGLRGVVYYHNFFGNQSDIEQIKITEETYRGGIKLNENIVALTSNSIVPEGKDKLIFYNVKKGNLTVGVEGYSFLVSEHNMVLIQNIENNSDIKILLCACKKYSEGQKNGILLINPQIGENKEIKNPFYDSNEFEIYCFCPILNIINNNENYDVDIIDENYKKNIEIKDTNFFLIGGYDDEKREGIIKLFKIIFNEKVEDTKIQFLQNIEICNKGDFQGFDEQIKCMIQSKITGNILITCADGNIYLFTKPNLDLYMEKNK